MFAQPRNERGIALPMAIFALVVIGGMVAGSFFIATQEQAVGRNSVRLQQAFSAAEEGAQLQMANWQSATYNAMIVGDSVTFSGTLSTGTGWYRGSIRRLSQMMFLVRSEGFNRDSSSRQQVGMLARLRLIEIDIQGALTTQGDTKIGGSSFISGHDTPPGAWTGCPATTDALAGIRINPGASITTSGCNNLDCVTGDPQVEYDSEVTEESMTTFGDLTFDELRALASFEMTGGTYKIEPVVNNGRCQTETLTNWGDPIDPTSPCNDYFPIIWVNGDLNINQLMGQGVLIVDGDLSVQGGFQFYGPVIVRGFLKTTGTGGHFNGGVVAANVALEQNTVLGDAVINYSSCALIRALTASASADLLQERSWINLY
ncbi:MAG: hypothetical protein WD043_04800 [Gemmatimonadales bacterium]